MDNDSMFSVRLAQSRRDKGLTQRELAEKSGLSHRIVAHYETHVAQPQIEKVEKLAAVLSVSVGYLLGLEPSGKNQSTGLLDGVDMRTIKKIQRLLMLNATDRSTVYRLIDALLQKSEYSGKNQNP